MVISGYRSKARPAVSVVRKSIEPSSDVKVYPTSKSRSYQNRLPDDTPLSPRQKGAAPSHCAVSIGVV